MDEYLFDILSLSFYYYNGKLSNQSQNCFVHSILFFTLQQTIIQNKRFSHYRISTTHFQ